MDANKIINNLSVRYANKVAVLEKEIAFLIAENDDLKSEIDSMKSEKEDDAE